MKKKKPDVKRSLMQDLNSTMIAIITQSVPLWIYFFFVSSRDILGKIC